MSLGTGLLIILLLLAFGVIGGGHAGWYGIGYGYGGGGLLLVILLVLFAVGRL